MYGCSGSSRTVSRSAPLGDPAGVHDGDVVRRLGDHPKVVGDQDDGRPVRLLEVADQVEDLSLHRHVERGRRLVGDQDLGVEGERHGDHDALSHAAGELVRVAVDSLGCARDPDLPERFERAAPRDSLRDVLVSLDRLDDLPPHLVERMERRQRILEDHRDALSADVPQLVRRKGQKVEPVEENAPFDGRIRKPRETHDGQGRDALARPGLTDDPQRAAAVEGEGDAVDGIDDAVASREANSQVLDLEQRHLSTGPVGRGRRRGCRRRCWR